MAKSSPYQIHIHDRSNERLRKFIPQHDFEVSLYEFSEDIGERLERVKYLGEWTLDRPTNIAIWKATISKSLCNYSIGVMAKRPSYTNPGKLQHTSKPLFDILCSDDYFGDIKIHSPDISGDFYYSKKVGNLMQDWKYAIDFLDRLIERTRISRRKLRTRFE